MKEYIIHMYVYIGARNHHNYFKYNSYGNFISNYH